MSDTDARDLVAEAALARHICAIAAGAEGALAELHSATQSRLFAYANRMLRDKQAAEEVVYDVYLYVWSHAHAFDAARSTPMTWLRMLCRSRALDRLRVKDRTMLVADFDALVADRATECNDPSDWCATNANQRNVRNALGRLTPVHRQLLALSFFSDLSHSEIAERCMLKLGTVKSHVRRGLAALRLELAGVGDDYV